MRRCKLKLTDRRLECVKKCTGKDEHAAALRAHQTAVDATKSPQREAANAKRALAPPTSTAPPPMATEMAPIIILIIEAAPIPETPLVLRMAVHLPDQLQRRRGVVQLHCRIKLTSCLHHERRNSQILPRKEIMIQPRLSGIINVQQRRTSDIAVTVPVTLIRHQATLSDGEK